MGACQSHYDTPNYVFSQNEETSIIIIIIIIIPQSHQNIGACMEWFIIDDIVLPSVF